MSNMTPKILDQKHIDVRDDGEVWYWTHKLGVTKQQLVAAVRQVGRHPCGRCSCRVGQVLSLG